MGSGSWLENLFNKILIFYQIWIFKNIFLQTFLTALICKNRFWLCQEVWLMDSALIYLSDILVNI